MKHGNLKIISYYLCLRYVITRADPIVQCSVTQEFKSCIARITWKGGSLWLRYEHKMHKLTKQVKSITDILK